MTFVFYTANLKNFYIHVSNNNNGSSSQQCSHEQVAFNQFETRVYTCPCGIFGRYVRIRFPISTSSYVDICEGQVQPGGKDSTF